jgi:hypothetical protein
MKIRTFSRLGAVVATTFVASGAHAGCDVWRDEIMKTLRGVCNLTLDPKNPPVAQVFLGNFIHDPAFKMPDLLIDKYKFEYLNHELWVYADVKNNGTQNAGVTNIGVQLTIVDPLGVVANRTIDLPPANPPMPRPVPAMPASTTQRIFLWNPFLDNSSQDWDIVVSGMVDQVTVAQPVRGAVTESNENNNGLIHTCRIYGPNPDTSVPVCN